MSARRPSHRPFAPLFVVVVLCACSGGSMDGVPSNDDPCQRANAAQVACGDPAGPSYPADQACDPQLVCVASCIAASACDWPTIDACIGERCQPAGPRNDAGSNTPQRVDSGPPPSPYDSGPGGGHDTGSGGGGSDTSSSTTTPPRPECVSYAEKYCGCLGSMASADCVSTRASGCEDSIDACPSFYACFLSSSSCGAGCSDC